LGREKSLSGEEERKPAGVTLKMLFSNDHPHSSSREEEKGGGVAACRKEGDGNFAKRGDLPSKENLKGKKKGEIIHINRGGKVPLFKGRADLGESHQEKSISIGGKGRPILSRGRRETSQHTT